MSAGAMGMLAFGVTVLFGGLAVCLNIAMKNN
ncbi:MetS family NSS transporter small subunit [Orenia marismortui]|uniref:MetS family NSS transporter small subunit n=1 Tax=Orenia marismortui TaxID=46469 RepID=A0A4R8GY75_9FIRM|nr:MetS family NSS transporter small subunit [Orenia marismortui]TDX51192.1 hypothetical protein C7959_11568 [Orenia marismortui]